MRESNTRLAQKSKTPTSHDESAGASFKRQSAPKDDLACAGGEGRLEAKKSDHLDEHHERAHEERNRAFEERGAVAFDAVADELKGPADDLAEENDPAVPDGETDDRGDDEDWDADHVRRAICRASVLIKVVSEFAGPKIFDRLNAVYCAHAIQLNTTFESDLSSSF